MKQVEEKIRCPPTQGAAHSKATPRDEHMAVSRNDSHKICPQPLPHPTHIGTPLLPIILTHILLNALFYGVFH